MDFDYSEEQRLLAESVRRFLARDYTFEARGRIMAGEGWSPQAWATLAEMGLTALTLPAEAGGFDGGAVDLMGVMEAFGEALVVEPFLPTVVAGRLVARGGSTGQRQALLPAVAEGRLRLALAQAERGSRYELGALRTTARQAGGQWLLDGEKSGVLAAPTAHKIVVSASTSAGPGLFVIDAPSATMKPFRTLDGLNAADLALQAVPGEPLAGGLELLEEAVDFATALVCAEAVGAMKYACEATLDYLKTRKQFGVPIGSFQALQHRMADMYIAQEQARSMACLACSRADAAASAVERSRAISAAKIKVADSARLISQEAVQLHGGMGMSEELKISHAFRRLTALAQQFGDADYHLERFARFS